MVCCGVAKQIRGAKHPHKISNKTNRIAVTFLEITPPSLFNTDATLVSFLRRIFDPVLEVLGAGFRGALFSTIGVSLVNCVAVDDFSAF